MLETELLSEASFLFFGSDLSLVRFEVSVVNWHRGSSLRGDSPSVPGTVVITRGTSWAILAIGAVCLVESSCKVDQCGQGGRLRGNAQQFVMQGFREVIAEGIHLGFVVHSSAGGMDGPFLVPFIERTRAHARCVHGIG